jgi:hypothetical protein
LGGSDFSPKVFNWHSVWKLPGRIFVVLLDKEGIYMRKQGKTSRWSIAAIAGILLIGGLGVASAQTLTGAVGAVVVNDNPYSFLTASDGNLWVNHFVGTSAVWNNLGNPGSASIIARVGVTQTQNNNPFTFVLGSDGNLWLTHWDGSGWPWNNLGNPGSASIVSTVGVTVTENNNPYVFVLGSDGNLWVSHWDGSGWPWNNLGNPGSASIAASVGVATVNSNIPEVYVTGSDGNLWTSQWNGSGWPWTNLGRPPSGEILTRGVGVILNMPDAWMLGTNGDLYEIIWNGSSWGWRQFSHPGSVSLSTPIGVTPGNGNTSPHFIGSDGNLWSYPTNAINWIDSGTPPGVALNFPVADVTLTNDGGAINVPLTLVVGRDGNLWGFNGSWSNQGAPPTTSGGGGGGGGGGCPRCRR